MLSITNLIPKTLSPSHSQETRPNGVSSSILNHIPFLPEEELDFPLNVTVIAPPLKPFFNSDIPDWNPERVYSCKSYPDEKRPAFIPLKNAVAVRAKIRSHELCENGLAFFLKEGSFLPSDLNELTKQTLSSPIEADRIKELIVQELLIEALLANAPSEILHVLVNNVPSADNHLLLAIAKKHPIDFPLEDVSNNKKALLIGVLYGASFSTLEQLVLKGAKDHTENNEIFHEALLRGASPRIINLFLTNNLSLEDGVSLLQFLKMTQCLLLEGSAGKTSAEDPFEIEFWILSRLIELGAKDPKKKAFFFSVEQGASLEIITLLTSIIDDFAIKDLSSFIQKSPFSGEQLIPQIDVIMEKYAKKTLPTLSSAVKNIESFMSSFREDLKDALESIPKDSHSLPVLRHLQKKGQLFAAQLTQALQEDYVFIDKDT